MNSRISYERAMEIAAQFAKRIRAELDSQAEVYLFGSVVTEKIILKVILTSLLYRGYLQTMCARIMPA